MAAEVEIQIIKHTQETLGTVIKKPTLNDKLLKKPPFKFLHDIISNVVKTTGFMKGLYSSNELNSENIKDKDSKIAFLQKAIDVLAMVTGESLSVRPSKVVAGHEPERTNEFLQALAKAVIARMDSTQAVQSVLGKNKEGKTKVNASKKEKPTAANEVAKKEKVNDAAKKEKPSRDPSKNGKAAVSRSNSHDRETSKNTKSKSHDRETAKNGSSPDKARVNGKTPSKKTKSTGSANNVNETDDTPAKEKPKPLPKQESVENNVPVVDEVPPHATDSPKQSGSTVPPAENIPDGTIANGSPVVRPSTVSKTRSRVTPNAKPQVPTSPEAAPQNGKPAVESVAENLQQRPASSMRYVKSAMRSAKSARPTTARPAPPRIRNKNIVTEDDTMRLASAKEVSSVILDTQDNDEDEGFVVEDQETAQPEETIAPIVETKATAITEDEQKGSLVRDMLDTKKDLEGGSQQPQHRRVEIDKSQMSNRIKDRESSSREVEQLRSFIQTVSRSANPLGKMLDYLQEDVDAMHQELNTWREERQHNLVSLMREEGVTEMVLDPLRNQLEELEQAVQDQVDKINAMKATILHNDDRIHRMLARQYKMST